MLKILIGTNIAQWLKTFCTMPVCSISSSNSLSEKFSITRDVTQGDPLSPSPTLFILCIKCFVNILRDIPLFNGLEIGDLSV